MNSMMMLDNFLDEYHLMTRPEINKFLLTTLLCGIIGAEREFKNKQAGLKTMIMIGLGATLITVLSVKISANAEDRIAANIVTGIGFLGAGVIFKEDNKVNGLTTACVIWIVAAIGMAVGAGFFEQAIGVTFLVLFSLLVFPFVETIFEKKHTIRTYRITKRYDGEGLEKYEEYFETSGLKLKRGKHQLVNGILTGNWEAQGTPVKHQSFVEKMMNDKNILEFDF